MDLLKRMERVFSAEQHLRRVLEERRPRQGYLGKQRSFVLRESHWYMCPAAFQPAPSLLGASVTLSLNAGAPLAVLCPEPFLP